MMKKPTYEELEQKTIHAGKIWMKQGPERGINFRVSISRNLQLSH